MVSDNDENSNIDQPGVDLPSDESEKPPEKKQKFSFRSLLQPRGQQGPPAEKSEVELELGLVKVLDFGMNDTFEWIYEKKMLENYRNKVITPFVGAGDNVDEFDDSRNRLSQKFFGNDIEGKFQSVVKTAEAVAQTKRIKWPFLKMMGYVQLVIFMILMIVFVVLTQTVFKESSGSLTTIYFLVICIVPQGFKMLTDRWWAKIKKELTPLLRESETENLREIKNFTEELIADLQDRVIAKGMDQEKVQFVLFSSDYNGLKEIQPQQGKGTPKFVVGFGNVQDVASKDLFILLKNAQFGDEGDLSEYDLYYATESEAERIEKLLNTSTFNSVDNPNDVFKEFNANTSVLCDCGDPIVFKDLKYCTSKTYKGFEFYLGVGNNSTCGKEPFILFTSPGNATIPERLQDLF